MYLCIVQCLFVSVFVCLFVCSLICVCVYTVCMCHHTNAVCTSQVITLAHPTIPSQSQFLDCVRKACWSATAEGRGTALLVSGQLALQQWDSLYLLMKEGNAGEGRKEGGGREERGRRREGGGREEGGRGR